MGIDTVAGHGPDDPLTPTERAGLLAWARAHPDSANHLAAVLVLRYEAALAAAEAARDQQTALVRQWDERDHAKTVRIAELERERDAARAEVVIQQQVAGATQLLLDRAEQRATRLAVLEQAVRRWVKTPPGAPDLDEAEDGILDAMSALDAPPGDSA